VEDCVTLFEKIIARQIPADIVYEDEWCVAFRDINPQAPIHVLVVPREPVVNVASAGPEHAELLGRVLLAAGEVARQLDIAEGGYRLVLNNGDDGGQTVDHLHCHIVGGRALRWPPG
jgi:histidine triad (HIT) family protein